MADCTIPRRYRRGRRRRQRQHLLVLALLALLLGSCSGRVPDGVTALLPTPAVRLVRCRSRRRHCPPARSAQHALVWAIARRSLPQRLLQVALLGALARAAAPSPWPLALACLPLLRLLLDCTAIAKPTWGQLPACQCARHTLATAHTLALAALAATLLGHWLLGPALLALTLPPGAPPRPKPTASGQILDDGTYQVVLGDQFVLRHKPVDEFDRRMFLLFLRDIHLLDRPAKRPFLCQVWLADWFGTLQELLSRWEDYHAAGDWQRLMSRRDGPLIPLEQQQTIIQLWARHLWWSVEEVTAALGAQGHELCPSRVQQVGRESGLLLARRVLGERFQLGPELLRPKQDWLVQQLFAQIELLLVRLEAGEGLTRQETCELAELTALRTELGLVGSGREQEKALPWGARIEQVLFGAWDLLPEDAIQCPQCGSKRVRRKSRTPRTKRYLDAQGQVQQVDVCRYYCLETACPRQSFTHLPPELLAYSPYRLEAHLLALQAYELGRSSYRRVARAVGVSTATSYRWVSAFGVELLPIAALFGVVRSSGVVGIDEKWVKVSTNTKPAGKHHHWMYVYLAVDAYTYDLLHIALAPTVGTQVAQAFLLSLRAKGYRPQVIVTDLNQDYTAAIAAVFPRAEHHECIFHALQGWRDQLRAVYGKGYQERCPEAAALRAALGKLFQTKSKRTAQRRYERVMRQREAYVATTPAVAGVFESLERHWLRLVNAIESERILRTTNTTELVIRRFEQHYQNFCGFNTFETAQMYLGVFERVYRFTPFTMDAQARLRGKCPLEVAGYDVSRVPMAAICRGELLKWSPEILAKVVPNV